MHKRLIWILAVTAALTGCSSTPTVQTGEDAEVIGGTLHKVDKSRAQLAYVDPDADLGKYNKVLIRPLGVDNIEVIQPTASRSTVYTEGAGSIAVMVIYGDSETGEVLGLAKDSGSSNSYWGQNNSVSNMAEVRRMFDSWAIQIRDGLDRVHGKK
mgnify:CR=1 FL=1